MNLPARLAPGLYRLGSYHISVFLIKGQGASALFEVGIGATAPLVLSQLDSLGVPREEVNWVILSHTHSDHATGQAGLLAGLPRARLVLSGASRKHLAKPAVASSFTRDDAFTSEQVSKAEDLAGPPWPGVEPLLPGEPMLAEAGQSLDIGGVRLELFSADAHAPGGLLAWLPQWGAFLASDSAGFHSKTHPGLPLYFVSFSGYLETLAKIRGLGPQILALGHQGWFEGSEALRYLEGVRDELNEQRRELRDWIEAGEEQAEITARMMERYYQAELAVYPPWVMEPCCRLLIKRGLER